MLSNFFIRRPIVAIVIAILTVVIGLVSMLNLPISQYPDIVPPEIQVQATYPGADAKTLEQSVSTPLEEQMNGVDNMLYMQSVNANNGQATLYVDFDVKTNPDTDQVLSQLRVSQTQSQLPPIVNVAGVTVLKSLHSPLLFISLNSPNGRYGPDFLTNYAIINLQDEITRVKGVSRVQIFGGQYAIRVWVQPDKMAQLGVTATDVINALSTQNNVYPAGQIGGEPVPTGQQFTYTVRTQGRLVTPEQFGNIILRSNRRRLHPPSPRRRAHRARHADLQPDRALQRRTVRHYGGLSAPRLQRRGGRESRPEAHERARRNSSPPASATTFRSTRPRPSPPASTRSSSRCSSRSLSSSWSFTSSCRDGAPPSSR